MAPGFVAEQKRRLVLALGCTGGRHRSVALVEDWPGVSGESPALVISVSHRDIEREDQVWDTGFTRAFREELARVEEQAGLLPTGGRGGSDAHSRELPDPGRIQRERAIRGPAGDHRPSGRQGGVLGLQGVRGGGGVAHAREPRFQHRLVYEVRAQGDAGGASGAQRDGGAQRQFRAEARHRPPACQEELLPERLSARLSHRRRLGQLPAEGGPSGDPHPA